MKTDHIISLVSNVREKANRLIIDELKRHQIEGLMPSHGSILNALFVSGSLSMQDLARRIDRDKSTVTSLVDKLEDRGLVERKGDASDSRVTLVTLTPKGRGLRSAFDEISNTLITKAFAGFRREEKEALVKGLERMLTNL